MLYLWKMEASQLEEPLSENDFYLEIQRQKNTHTPNRTLVKIDTNYPNWLTSYNDHQKLTFSVIYLFITGSYSGTFQ